MALAGLAAINQQSLAGNGMMQMDNAVSLSSSYHSNEADRGVSYGGGNEAARSMGIGGSAAAPSSSNANAAWALGMLAQSAFVNEGNNYNPDENEQNDHSDNYQSG